MDITALSARYSVRRLTPDDAQVVYALCRENSLYYQHCPPFVTEEGIIGDMAALPPRKTLSDKYYVGYFDGEKLVGVLGVRKDRRHICFFFVDGQHHRRGIGTGLFRRMLEDFPGRTITVNSSPYGVPFYMSLGFAATDSEQTVNGIRFTPMVYKGGV